MNPTLRPKLARGPATLSRPHGVLTGSGDHRGLGLPVLLALLCPTLARAQFTPSWITQEQLDPPGQSSGFWLDRVQQGLHRLVWRTARSIDSWMGPPLDEEVYQEASGSVAVALLSGTNSTGWTVRSGSGWICRCRRSTNVCGCSLAG